jgi:phosphatidate cytidylyltransferase
LLRNRLISAFFLISGSLVFVGLDAWTDNFGCPGFWMLPLGFYLILGSAVECTTMISRSPTGSVARPALIGCTLVMLSGCIPLLWPLSGQAYPSAMSLGKLEWPLIAAAVSLIGCAAYYFPDFQANSPQFVRSILAGWISCYFGICFSMAIAVRMIGPPSWGLFLLIGLVVVTKLADSGAYFAGRALGRTKLCPKVSPNKTVEGLLGGMVVSSLGAWIYFGPFADALLGDSTVGISLAGSAIVGVCLTLAGLQGDLLESVFKREFGCKDSGTMLPGLGGLWDVTDSILPAVVVGYILARGGVLVSPGP